MGLPYPDCFDQHERRPDGAYAVNCDDSKLFICNKCSNHLSISAYDSSSISYATNSSLINYKCDAKLEILNNRLVVNKIYCNTCSNQIGFKVISLIINEPELIPLDLPNSELNQFKNNLINIENHLNLRFETMKYIRFLQSNKELIGKYCLDFTRVKSVNIN